jgi:hypothetical protein
MKFVLLLIHHDAKSLVLWANLFLNNTDNLLQR